MDFELLHPADQLVEMMNRIYKYGMTTTSGGNLSIRDENGDIWITPSGVDKGNLTRNDIMQVKPDGSYIGKHKPSVELPFHRDIYGARPDIFGVVHAHPPVMVGFAVVRREPQTRIVPDAWKICGKVAQVPYDVAGSLELDANINARFKEGYNTVLMANHGVVCGAKNLKDAFVAFETITLTGEAELNAMRLGGVHTLTEKELEAGAQEKMLPAVDAEMPVSEEEQKLRMELCTFARRCYDRKLLSAVQGCISVRFEDGMLITPAGKDHMRLKPEEIVRVKNGSCEKGKVPGEAANLHLKIYAAHSDIHSIIITHAPAIMGYAVSGKPFESETMSEGYVILGEVQQAKCENGVLDEDKIASMFGYRKNIVQLDNRCAIITGENLFKTFDKAEVLEYGAASVIAACGLGRPVPLSEAEIRHTNKELGL